MTSAQVYTPASSSRAPRTTSWPPLDVILFDLMSTSENGLPFFLQSLTEGITTGSLDRHSRLIASWAVTVTFTGDFSNSGSPNEMTTEATCTLGPFIRGKLSRGLHDPRLMLDANCSYKRYEKLVAYVSRERTFCTSRGRIKGTVRGLHKPRIVQSAAYFSSYKRPYCDTHV